MNTFTAQTEPIVDSLHLKSLLAGTSDKCGKMHRLVQAGELFRLRRGLYATRRDINPHCLAGPIYGPSYISFETALAFHGMIPERVHEVMSATIRRPSSFENSFGRYRYLRVPKAVYHAGVERMEESGVPFLIASPTKALCDRIALESRMRSMSDVRRWAELMRLEVEVELDSSVLTTCAEGYGRPSVRLFRRTLDKYGEILP